MPHIFPEPYVVPGQVAGMPYRDSLAFKQKTVVVWCAYCAICAYFAFHRLPMSGNEAAVELVLALLALTVIRRIVVSRQIEIIFSTLVCLATQAFLGTTLAVLREDGLDLSLLAAVPIGLALYTLFAGHDFSHFGYAALSVLFVPICAWMTCVFGWLEPQQAIVGSVVAIIVNIYVVSDLSMLMRRRLPGEELGAATDIFRDVLNFMTYTFRVIAYRRKYRFHAH